MSIKKGTTIRRLRAGAERDRETELGGEWRRMFVAALPLLEWVAANGSAAGPERQEEARRLIVRHYIRATEHPGVARAEPRDPDAS